MIMEISFILLFVFLVTYEPIWGFISTQKLKKIVHTQATARLNYYNATMIGLWTPTLFILALVGMTPLTLKDIGLTGISLNTTSLGPWFTYIAIGLFILYSLILVINYIAIKVNLTYKQKAISEMKKQHHNDQFGVIFPRTRKEKTRWKYVSFTAGFTEEIIYRGFLIFAILYFYPTISMWFVLVIAALVFGLAHTYQGITGVIRTGLIGFVFGAIYIAFGSIIPLILLHFLIDLAGGVDVSEQ
ncbi:CPBP family intramembrane metalloprotease [Bacillus sp. BGMRC 2118]|nr:CPBP family intramembrane metalloprotease [Bacillus sp. BGMRC 2118]